MDGGEGAGVRVAGGVSGGGGGGGGVEVVANAGSGGLGGGCQSGLTIGGYIDLALGFDTEGYDVTLTIGYPFSLHSSFFFLSLRYSKRHSASCTHKPRSCTYIAASSSPPRYTFPPRS